MNLGWPALAFCLLAALAGLVIRQRSERLQLAYEARRLLEDVGELTNELGWLDAQILRLRAPAAILPRAASLGWTSDRLTGVTVRAPAPRPARSAP